MIGAPADLGYPYRQVGYSPVALRDWIEGKHEFANFLVKAPRTRMIIIGAGALARADGCVIHAFAREVAETYGMIRDEIERL